MRRWQPGGEGRRRRKRREPLRQAGLAAPVGPPPEDDLYRCLVGGADMLVKAARMEVAIGAAPLRGDYREGMPRMGCPGYNGETSTPSR